MLKMQRFPYFPCPKWREILTPEAKQMNEPIKPSLHAESPNSLREVGSGGLNFQKSTLVKTHYIAEEQRASNQEAPGIWS